MTPERWRQIEAIFNATMDRQPAVRANFLQDACGGDEDLRRSVERLLEPGSQDGEILRQPIQEIAHDVFAPSPTDVGFSVGSMAGPYRIGELLGKGGMGEVYRAQDTRLKRQVAIKTLKARFTDRFEREARAISALNHPHICTLFDIGSQDGIAYLVMEYVEGEPLKGPLPIQQALRFAIQIAGALEAAHEKGILHRDLKPGNILISKSGVKLLDFGLAKFMPGDGRPEDVTATTSLTGIGQVIGTPAYMPPEQFEGKPADARSDIFSFGMVIYEMLAGKRPFQAASYSGLRDAILTQEPTSLSTLLPAIPVSFERTVRKCMAKDPAQRWQTVADLRDELVWISERDSAPTPTPPVRRQALLPWMVAAGVLAVVAAFGWWMFWRSNTPGDSSLLRLSTDLGPDSVAGSHITAAISPDGTRLAFPVHGADGMVRLATRRLDQTQTSVLTGTEGADDPFFSPDGQWIGFFADGKMKKVSIRGNAAVVLCDAISARGAAWGEDDNIIVTLGGSSGVGLSRVPAAGGTPQTLTKPADRGEATHRWPQILPGGQTVLFMANKAISKYDDSIIEALSLKTSEITVVQPGGYFGRYLPGGYLVYINHGTLFGVRFDLKSLKVRGAPTPLLDDIAGDPNTAGGQYDFSRNGTFVYLSGKSSVGTWGLTWLDNVGIRPLLPPEVFYEPRFSPNGKRLAFSSGTDIEIYDLGRETRERLTRATQAVNNCPVWTPDGKHIVFVSEGANKSWLSWIRADGTGGEQPLLESQYGLIPNSFSPDGKRLAFSQAAEKGWDLLTLPLDTSDPEHPKAGKPEVFLRTSFFERDPVFSPDGRWIAYSSSQSGRPEIYVRPFPPETPGKWPVSTLGGRFPIWSSNRKDLFYEDLDNRIMTAAYTANGDSFAAQKPRVWSKVQLADITGHSNLDLDPAGQRFVIAPRADWPGQPNHSVHVTFLMNFFDEVKRRTAKDGQGKATQDH